MVPVNFKGYFQVLIYTSRLAWRASRLDYTAIALIALTRSTFPVVSVFLSSKVIGLLALAAASKADAKLVEQLALYLGSMLCVALVSELLTHLYFQCEKVFQLKITHHLQEAVARKTASVDYACFDDASFHDQLHLVASETTYRPVVMLQLLFNILGQFAAILSFASIVWAWNPWLILILAGLTANLLVNASRHSRESVAGAVARAETERRANYLNGLFTAEWIAKEMRILSFREHLLTRLKAYRTSLLSIEKVRMKKRFFSEGLLSALTALAQPMIVSIAVGDFLVGRLTFEAFSLNTQASLGLGSSLQRVAAMISGLEENVRFAATLKKFLDLHEGAERGLKLSVKRPTIPPRVVFDNVSFKYPNSDRLIIEKLSFSVEPGEFISIVGDNAAGKSTIVKLLAGLYWSTSGQIRINNEILTKEARARFRGCFGFMLQDFNIYSLSIGENVELGDVARGHDEDAMRMACRRTVIDDIATNLPMGYQTTVGRSFEGGHELSGGQRQSLAIARALYRDAPFIILDEPTAFLDVKKEESFIDQLVEAHRKAGKSVLLVSHNLKISARADRILVLEQGRLVEQGNHARLMAADGKYAALVRLQHSASLDSNYTLEPGTLS